MPSKQKNRHPPKNFMVHLRAWCWSRLNGGKCRIFEIIGFYNRGSRSAITTRHDKGMILKPQDIVILLALALPSERESTNRTLAADLFMSTSEISGGISRLRTARLLRSDIKQPMKRAMEEFLLCGVKYAYPPDRGGQTRGLPTSYAAPPLSRLIVQPNTDPPVWPDPAGPVRGYSFSPLYRTVPQAAMKDTRLYEMLALLDALRDGRLREVEAASQELKKRLSAL